MKVHLKDGSTVLFPNGVTVTVDSDQGVRARYDLTLTNSRRDECVISGDRGLS